MALRSPVPTGTVTLLFTDIEGSTQRWEDQRAAMPDALRRHDQLVRTAIEAHDGHIFKTMGDQFCAAFSRASDAVAAATDAQRALDSQDWNAIDGLRVRMALHSGATDERDGDYFGSPVNRVARLLGVVHGGQVIVSGATAQLLRGAMPAQAELRDLGQHRLKDLVEAEHVWQLVTPGLRESFPPLRSLETLPNNLPRQVTPLIGRDDVVANITPQLLEHPLVTLVGTGGVGKTRLALQVAADLLDGSNDGVWFIELAGLSDPAAVGTAIASIFGLREQGERPILDVLVQYLRPRKLLLILDNCEHLIEEVARIVDAMLRAAPEMRILATSREPLRIGAERVYRVPSLTVPAADLLTSETALQYGAIALFAERARASDAKFELTDESAPIVADICRRLDGIALAIELAAARVRVLPPRQLAQKLDERFRVLTGGSRAALPRQQTMRALIDWSYDLLSEREQRLFRRIAIFSGGAQLEAAEAVCTDETLDALDVLDLLSSLAEKSLVVADIAEMSRYRLLESTRAFALEKLAQSGESEAVALRHARWAADCADQLYEAWLNAPTAQWRAEFEPELENARTAIEWALAHDEIVLAARIIVGFSVVYRMLAGETEVRARLLEVLERLDAAAHPAVAARVAHALCVLAMGMRKAETAQRAVDLGELCNDSVTIVLGLRSVADGLRQAGRSREAQVVIDRALRLAKEHGLTRLSIYPLVLNVVATVAYHLEQFDDARQAYAEGLALATDRGYDDKAVMLRMNLAELEFRMENVAGALELANAIVAGEPNPRSDYFVIHSLVNGAAYRIALGDIAGARNWAHDGLRYARGAFALDCTFAIGHLATVAARNGDPRRGGRLRGYLDAWFRRNEGYEREPTEQRAYDILMTALHEQLTDAEIETLAAEGALLSEDRAVAEALAVR